MEERWYCNAIDRSVTFFADGKIAPCCLIDNFRRPLSAVKDPRRFKSLLTTGDAPKVCWRCTEAENRGEESYRQQFNKVHDGLIGVTWLDIRNDNLCNLKCRTCGPHFSSQWAKELKLNTDRLVVDISKEVELFLTPSLRNVYITGGEPMMIPYHWELLTKLIELGHAHRIRLIYNTNLTTIKYKDVDIWTLWEKFEHVDLQCSVDVAGEANNFIRSGSDWERIEENLNQTLTKFHEKLNNLSLTISITVSALNFWWLEDTLKYFKEKNINVNLVLLQSPQEYRISVFSGHAQQAAIKLIDNLLFTNTIDYDTQYKILQDMIEETNEIPFQYFVDKILDMDKLRGESLYPLYEAKIRDYYD